jgi:outer membrane receptor protein involved in Fe transport
MENMDMVSKKPWWTLITLTAALSAYTQVSLAEEEGRRKNVFLEEVVVTARKKSEDSQDAPLAISAYSGDMIEAAGMKDLTDVAAFTPGFSFNDDFGRTQSERPVIRGQATIKGESGVSTFIDGVRISGSILDYDLNEVERIEIIKGPQSALYGRNTYSGAISITTKNPTDELSGSVKLDVAEYGQQEISASIRGPLVEGILSGGLTGRSYERGGVRDNLYDGNEVGQQESQSISGVLYFTPNDDLDIRVRSRWSNLDDDQLRLFLTSPDDNNCYGPDNGGVYMATPDYDPTVGNTPQGFNASYGQHNYRYYCGEIEAQDINTDETRMLGGEAYDRRESWESSLALKYQLTDAMSLTWTNGYNRYDSEVAMDFGSNPTSLHAFATRIGRAVFMPGIFESVEYVHSGPIIDFAEVNEGDGWEFSSEFRFAYEAEQWNGLFGAYYFENENNLHNMREAPADFDAIVKESWDLAETWAVGEYCQAIPGCGNNNGNAVAPGSDILVGGLAGAALVAKRNEIQNTIENVGIFAMLEFDVTDRLTTSFEVRVAKEKITSSTVVFAGTAKEKSVIYQYGVGGFVEGYNTFDESGTSPLPIYHFANEYEDYVREETFRSVSPRFTTKYAVNDDTNAYFIIAGGTKPGGFNPLSVQETSPETSAYDEETVLGYELGIKTSGFDGRMRFNAAIYHNVIEDYQLTESIVVNTQSVSVSKNAGKVRIQGVEMDVIYALEWIDGLTLNANYAFSDSTFLEGEDLNEGKLLDVSDDGRVNCSTVGMGMSGGNFIGIDGEECLTTGDNTARGSIVGRELPNAPKHMANIGANYFIDLNDTWAMIFNANASYESKKYVQVHNEAWVGARTIVTANVALESENFRFVVWGKNLTDDDTPLSASRFADESLSFQRSFFGAPRTGRQFGATATYMF